MAAIEISCLQCGSNEYRVVDERTGEVACQYCRSQWIVPELARKSETEKFMEQQAQQPRVTYDNTTETDKQLMEVITSVASVASGGFLAGCRATLSRIARTLVIVAVTVVVILVAILLYRQFG
jgi:uncharacterized Zn finger protein (UPF0148 family)